MKTIKIIDLLNKIANGEIPQTIIFDTEKYEYISGHYIRDYDGISIDLNDDYNLYRCLNDEVEILDEEDEFEDIDEVEYHYERDGTIVEIDGSDWGVDGAEKMLIDKVNSLIYNQKKIIERLKDK